MKKLLLLLLLIPNLANALKLYCYSDEWDTSFILNIDYKNSKISFGEDKLALRDIMVGDKFITYAFINEVAHEIVKINRTSGLLTREMLYHDNTRKIQKAHCFLKKKSIKQKF